MTVTNVQQQDARAVAIDAAIVAALRLHALEFEVAYLGDDIQLWLEPTRSLHRLLNFFKSMTLPADINVRTFAKEP
jgi:hypothetical protein